ncbi:MAG: hypothetical protein H6672_15845 [Anaerolineaceae bacterium]|nr:hypothetical protein [Anaerolineaceae bacterium]
MERTRRQFIVRWIVATLAGWILGFIVIFTTAMLWELIGTVSYRNHWNPNSIDWLFPVLQGLTVLLVGFSFGLAQWQIALKGKVPRRWWLAANSLNVIAALVGLWLGRRTIPSSSLFTFQSGTLSGFDTVMTVNETGLITSVAAIGAFVGIAVSLPQWLVLRHSFQQAYQWILGAALGGIAASASFVMIVLIMRDAVLSYSLCCCSTPIIFGGVTGYVLFDVLKRAKTE